MNEIRRRAGRPPKLGDRARKVLFLMPADELEALDQWADDRRWSRAEAVRELLRHGLRAEQRAES